MKDKKYHQIDVNEDKNKIRYFSVIESLLFVSGDPLELKDIASIIECSKEFTGDLLRQMMKKYDNDNSRGIKIVKLENKYQLVTQPNNGDFVQKLLKTNIRQSLSQAALETLAIIAYRQPITRVEIEEVRGVKCDRAIHTLADKKLIKESGRKEVPGRPILYVTSEEFLKYFDLENLNSLPKIEGFDDTNEDIVEELDYYISNELNSKEEK